MPYFQPPHLHLALYISAFVFLALHTPTHPLPSAGEDKVTLTSSRHRRHASRLRLCGEYLITVCSIWYSEIYIYVCINAEKNW